MASGDRITVLGGGSFGTAVANIIATNGHPAFLWMRNGERAARCQRERQNADYLPGYTFSPNLTVTSDFDEALRASNIVFISVPSGAFREVARRAAPLLQEGAMVISTTKGIEAQGFTLMSQILQQELPGVPIGVLSGPNFAKEIVQRQLTGTVIASEEPAVLAKIPAILSSDTFRVYTNEDLYGVELGGALKNMYAIMAGMAAALGVGHNSTAMLLTRSLAEMGRFATRLGADPMTFLGLSGVGDLILTCTSDLSRNYRLGYAVGKGESVEAAMAEIGQAVEGVNTVKLVKQKAEELSVYMPLVCGLYAVLFEGKAIADVMRQLMLGEQNKDVEYTRAAARV
ncbi:NAD(P)H-dependent glycerol-3-phosphate dehydrogenase [Gilvimarinus sp. F26214L]|uniref:NAD(P)H-dependent glycerol-3-phosphate dehydrogenase n=1 Tax=Gilvimarinus sp. DZF01 TaxID=3461371 RepID=UPI004045DC6D